MTDIDKAREAYEAMIPAANKPWCPACHTDHHPNFPCKRGRGRPAAAGTPGESRSVNLPPEQWEWLRSQPDGASAAVRRLIAAAMAN